MNNAETEIARSGRILIVDDTPANLHLLMHMLTERGYRVHPAESGELALRFLQTTLPDLILLDILMPAMDGYELCRRLKADGRTRDIPVIFLSAVGEVLNKVKAFAIGGADYIVKPFQAEEVLARIETQLTLRDLQKRLEQRVYERTFELVETNARLNGEIVERKRAEAALRTSEERYRALYNATPSMYFTVTPDGIVRLVNQFGLDQLGYSLGELAGQSVANIFYENDRAAAIEHLAECAAHPEQVFRWELRKVRKDGHVLWVKETAQAALDPDGSLVLLIVCDDVTERRQAEDHIRHLAHHDALTGLPNRSLIGDRANQAIAQAQRLRHLVAMLFVDLDYFKNINDSLGHQVGDRLLQVIATRLQHCLRKGDSVGRLGGDEFVLCLPALIDSGDAAQVAQKVLDAVDVPANIDGHELHLSGSIGISLYPGDGADTEGLMRAADTAMYHAKSRGRHNYQFFTQDLNAAAQKRLKLENQLRQALSQDEFAVYYQPQIDMESGKIFSAEALLRWQQPGAQAVSCCEFIAVAEESSLILPIGAWVLREACRQVQRWRSTGSPWLRIAVNLSARQLYQQQFQEVIRDILAETGVPASALELEITESILVQPSEDNLAILQDLSVMGVKLSLDDFGTGYSSLSYLQRFPVDALKIDRSFVHGIGHDQQDTAIVVAIIAMAQSLHLKVIAEGVESLPQAAFLKAHGCLAAQGYYYGKPMSAAEFTALLQKESYTA